MRVRDAVEADAEAMAAIADAPTDVMVNLVHDRTVSVAEHEPADGDAASDGESDAASDGESDDAPDGESDDAADAEAHAETDGAVADEPAESTTPATAVDAQGEAAATGDDEDATAAADIRGFVSYDANESVVHVTQIDGDLAACERLLDEPVRFAAEEGMRVELLVTDADGDVATAAERVGFERNGTGPRFDGETTVRYDLHPN
jgi:hypothetical protein